MPLVRASTHASHVYEEKYAEAFSPMGSAELWAVSRHKALRAKNIASAIFFTLFFFGAGNSLSIFSSIRNIHVYILS